MINPIVSQDSFQPRLSSSPLGHNEDELALLSLDDKSSLDLGLSSLSSQGGGQSAPTNDNTVQLEYENGTLEFPADDADDGPAEGEAPAKADPVDEKPESDSSDSSVPFSPTLAPPPKPPVIDAKPTASKLLFPPLSR